MRGLRTHLEGVSSGCVQLLSIFPYSLTEEPNWGAPRTTPNKDVKCTLPTQLVDAAQMWQTRRQFQDRLSQVAEVSCGHLQTLPIPFLIPKAQAGARREWGDPQGFLGVCLGYL